MSDCGDYGDYDDENDNNKHDDDNAVCLAKNIGLCIYGLVSVNADCLFMSGMLIIFHINYYSVCFCSIQRK